MCLILSHKNLKLKVVCLKLIKRMIFPQSLIIYQ